MSTSWQTPLEESLRIVESQHKEIFDLADRFLAGATRAEKGLDLAGIVRTLTIFLRLHLDVEEGLMKRSGYPGLAEHLPSHRSLLDKIAAVARKNEAGSLAADEVRHLIESFNLHHDNADRSFMLFVRSQVHAPA